MTDTSMSLLDRLRQSPDEENWRRLVEIYSPLIRDWLRRRGVQSQDAEDLLQEVLVVVVRKLPSFERAEHAHAFRGWLRSITANCLRDLWRKAKARPTATSDYSAIVDQLADPNSGLSHEWDLEYDRQVTRHLLQLVKPQFAASTFLAFRRLALEGQTPEQVAAELGISVNAVFIAKSRVLAQLRREGAGLVD